MCDGKILGLPGLVKHGLGLTLLLTVAGDGGVGLGLGRGNLAERPTIKQKLNRRRHNTCNIYACKESDAFCEDLHSVIAREEEDDAQMADLHKSTLLQHEEGETQIDEFVEARISPYTLFPPHSFSDHEFLWTTRSIDAEYNEIPRSLVQQKRKQKRRFSKNSISLHLKKSVAHFVLERIIK